MSKGLTEDHLSVKCCDDYRVRFNDAELLKLLT